MSNAATDFSRFKQSTDTPSLAFVDGPYTASVVFVCGSWSWVVWKDGAVVDGHKSFHMDAHKACEAAIDCINVSKAIPTRTIDQFFNTTEI